MRPRHFLLAVLSALVMMAAVPAPLSASRRSEIGPYPAMVKEFGYKDFDFIKIMPLNKALSGRGAFVRGVYDIHIVKSDQYKVVMRVWDRDDIELFDIRKEGNVLELLSAVRKYPYHTRNVATPRAEVTIYTPTFSGGDFNRCEDVSVSGEFSGKSLSVSISYAAKLKGLSGSWDNAVLDISNGASMDDVALNVGDIKVATKGAGIIGGKSTLRSDSMTADMSGGSEIALLSMSVRALNVNMAGAAVLSSKDVVNMEELKTIMSGGSSLRLDGNISAVTASLSGAASLSLRGAGTSLNMQGAGGSSLKAKEFSVKEASIVLTGASSAVLNVTGKLTTNVSGASSVDYYGKPKSIINKSSNVREH